jgi:hypothetical protein
MYGNNLTIAFEILYGEQFILKVNDALNREGISDEIVTMSPELMLHVDLPRAQYLIE